MEQLSYILILSNIYLFSGSQSTTKTRVKILSVDELKHKATKQLKQDSTETHTESKKPAGRVRIIRYMVQKKAGFSEQLEKFYKMKPADLPQKKPRACEAKELPRFPVDTIRCWNCHVLYEPTKHAEHALQCKKKEGAAQQKYGCLKCKFTNNDIEMIRKHMAEIHPTKK